MYVLAFNIPILCEKSFQVMEDRRIYLTPNTLVIKPMIIWFLPACAIIHLLSAATTNQAKATDAFRTTQSLEPPLIFYTYLSLSY
ncbi:hypothetical protein Lmor_0568 [Legionella moravica]|uniref:Uncharacterized protein n=1 Tax=Legionella moravica TaxID=39962 RepID=A0ABR5RHR1_9GAMM|nr:hypothetical protein Lmor_0568 [Legionella moravica]